MIMTSTHPTMGNKLLNLGVRKNMLQKVDNYYLVNPSEELGDLVIFKKRRCHDFYKWHELFK